MSESNLGEKRVGPKWSVAVGEMMPVTTMVRTWVGRCETCGFLATGHQTESGARSELRKHHQGEHPDEYPTHDDGSPCFHTKSDCTEHGSCIDCDLCKLLCECN